METIHPRGSSVSRWHEKFMETGSMLDSARSGRPRVSSEDSSSSEFFLQHVICKLFTLACHLAEVSVTFSFRNHAILTFFAEPCALL